MLVEQLISNNVAMTELRRCLSTLNQINFFGAMLEFGAKRSILQPSNNPMETAAITGSWHNGYVAALEDIFNFVDNVVEKKDSTVVDFGALSALLEAGEITQGEYDRLNSERKR